MKRPKYPQIDPVYYLAIETESGLKAARIRARSFNTAKVLLTERLGPVEHFQVNADWKGQKLAGWDAVFNYYYLTPVGCYHLF